MTVIDCTMYFGGEGERALIPIRFSELRPAVDRFLIVEGDTSFQGLPHRPAFFDDYAAAADRYPDLRHLPIDYHVVYDWPVIPELVAAGAIGTATGGDGALLTVNTTPAGRTSWQREVHLRNSVTRFLEDDPPDTVVLLSDFDEIPRAGAVPREMPPGTFHRFGGPYSLYALNLRLAGGFQWYGSRAIRLDDLRRTTAEEARQQRGEGGIGGQPGDRTDAAWHFSFLGGADTARDKLAAWRHPELNRPDITGPALEERIAARRDWWPERSLPLEWCPIDDSYPQWVREHQADLAPFILSEGDTYP